ncbi:cadherin-like beta sandwich domain-containing protein [Derxia lacustris]|uniref:cadherin-like beta sandwich domain-containing protein n=1 Tax=Derxia lacustris TaxID=764842 RepID=UPI000A1701C0|nr:cadherin-like beta sandwich domain-containing protein [Derxia lacustris]
MHNRPSPLRPQDAADPGPPARLSRRSALAFLGASTLAAGCGGGGSDGSSTSTGSTTTTTTLSADASLAALALSSGTLSPAFAAATTAYSVAVGDTVTSVTVTPTVNASGATVKVNGTTVASGSASAAIALASGSNSIAVLVTAADGSTTRSYGLTVTRATTTASSCALIPTETQGPYPLLAILSNSAIVRSDITESKTGVPLTLRITLENVNNNCAPLSNVAVYIWHCDKDGVYSGYAQTSGSNTVGQTFLRGVQTTDSNGQVEFTTIYPGWYAGRITHIHMQAYLAGNLGGTAVVTTQFAFPLDITAAVYASTLYASHGQNTSVTSFAADNVFSDGTTREMLTLSGDVTSGFVATITAGIAV